MRKSCAWSPTPTGVQIVGSDKHTVLQRRSICLQGGQLRLPFGPLGGLGLRLCRIGCGCCGSIG